VTVLPRRAALLLAVLLTATLAAALSAAESRAAPRVPAGFFGVHVRSLQGGDYGAMRSAGVGLVRTGFSYSVVRPQPLSGNQMPRCGGITTMMRLPHVHTAAPPRGQVRQTVKPVRPRSSVHSAEQDT